MSARNRLLLGHVALPKRSVDVAMGHNLWLHFGVDEHPFATYFDVHQGFLGFEAHSHVSLLRKKSWFSQ